MITLSKKYLSPKTYHLTPTKGFTLIELMVAIAIVAVLATIGFSLFQNTQSQARDAKRKQDIDSIATAMEQKFNAATGSYSAIANSDFTTQSVPTDPLSPTYNYTVLQGGSPITITNGTAPAPATSYVICAKLENNTGNSSDTAGASAPNGGFYCRQNQQQ